MSKITATDHSILFQMRDETLLFEPYGPDTIRLRATRNGTFSEEKWTLLDPLPAECTVTADEHSAHMTVGSLTVDVWKGWQRAEYRFTREGKEILRSREPRGGVGVEGGLIVAVLHPPRQFGLADQRQGDGDAEMFLPRLQDIPRQIGTDRVLRRQQLDADAGGGAASVRV